MLFLIILNLYQSFYWTSPENLHIRKVQILWKKTFWNASGYSGWASFDWPLVVDLNNDGILEIVKYGQDSIYIYSYDGKILKRIPKMGGIYHETFLFGDYDSDGAYEILFSKGGAIIFVDSRTFNIERIFNITFNSSHDRSDALIAGDFDGDKKLELAVEFMDAGLFIADPVENWTRFLGYHYNECNLDHVEVYPVDADEDGIDELFFVSPSSSCVGLIDAYGNVWWHRIIPKPKIPGASRDLPAPSHAKLGDFDRDGAVEVVFTTCNSEIYVVDVRNGRIKAYFYVRQPQRTFFSFCDMSAFVDIDNDGVIEGIFLFCHIARDIARGDLVVVDMSNYKVKKIVSFEYPDEYTWFGIDDTSIAIVDFNLDGYYDIVTITYKYIVFIDGKKLLASYYYDMSELDERYWFYWFPHSQYLVVLDLDNDGCVEIVKPNSEEGIVVYRVYSKFIPLVYWVSPWGYYDAMGRFDLFDSDFDGVADWVEVKYGFDPRSPDSDHDGISDRMEILELLKKLSIKRMQRSSNSSFLAYNCVEFSGDVKHNEFGVFVGISEVERYSSSFIYVLICLSIIENHVCTKEALVSPWLYPDR